MGLQVGIVNPCFFFGQIATPFEVWPSPHPPKPQFSELVHRTTDRCRDGGVGLAFDRQCFVVQLREIALTDSADQNRPTEITIAGIVPLKLMPLDNSIFLSQ